MNWQALIKRRTDLGLTAVVGLAGASAGLDASSLVAVLGGSAVAVGAGLWLTVRGINREALREERAAETQATITYLAKPEHERNIEMLATGWVVAQRADELFRTNFDYSGPSDATAVACQLCAWKSTGQILADARTDALSHLHEAHGLAA
jgi:hypothetical protein